MSNCIMVIDCNAVCHMLKHSMGYLSDGVTKTGIIYGFLGQIKKFSQEFSTSKFAFCWDSIRSFRKQKFEWYKLNRKKDYSPEEQAWNSDCFRQFSLLRMGILPRMGFKNIIQVTGYESDDLIASIVKNDHGQYNTYIVVSSDNDLYQLLNSCSIFDLKKKSLYTKDNFNLEFGISPSQWVDVKMLAGCKTDNVPGIKGVGELTAIKYLTGGLKGKKFSEIDKYYQSRPKFLQDCLWLTKLPLDKCPIVKLDFTHERFDTGEFIKICETHKFKSLLQPHNLSFWKNFFKK